MPDLFASPLAPRGLTAIAALAVAASPAIAFADEEEPPGVPHIVFEDDGGVIELEFEGTDGFFEEFGPGDIPTLTIFLSEYDELSGEYRSRPINGLADGFLNDDIGFKTEDDGPLPTGTQMRVTLTTIESVPLGYVTLPGEINAEGEFIQYAAFDPSEPIDDHPTWGLAPLGAPDPSFIGEASLLFTITDEATNGLTGSPQFRLILTTDPGLAVIPEPTSVLALGLAGLPLIARRRRR